MTIERKFTALKDLKLSDEGSGTIEGYRSVFGEIDEGGDIVIKGAFADGMNEYLHSGFTAHSHDWDFDKAVGFPLEAHEDDYGWFVKSQFHSTPDSQNIRTKAKERMEAGKQVGFSFGYSADSYVYVEQKDYDRDLAQYIKPERLEENLKKAQRFSRIRVLKKVGTIEDSLVTAGMNKLAAATAVKSDDKTAKGMLAEQMAQTTPSTWEVESALRRVICKIAETAKTSDVTGVVIDWKAKVAEAINEYPPTMIPLVTAQIEEFLTSSDDEFYLKDVTGTDRFESFEDAGTALTKFAQKMRSNHEVRLKEGRMLSTSNRAKVQTCMDKIMELHAELSDLMAMSEPKPKEDGKEFDLVALRTQSARLRNHALRTLARIA